MKFSRYLQDTQAPEWGKAYIDYRGLKVQLAAIRAQQVDALRSWRNGDVNHTHRRAPSDEEKFDNSREVYLNRGITKLPMKWRDSDKKTSSLFQDPGSPTPSPLRVMRSNLPAKHAKFFDMLDVELDRVEAFYAEREEEMHQHVKLLRKQLNELGKHRQLFYQSSAQSRARIWARRAYISVSSVPSSMIRWFSGRNRKSEEAHQADRNDISVSESGRDGHRGFVDTVAQAPRHRGLTDDHLGSWRKNGITKRAEKYFSTTSFPKAADGLAKLPPKCSDNLPNPSSCATGRPLDPCEYEYAKRMLRKAVVEYYRGLQILNGYRTLNLTGFRQALKKYGKITKVSVLDAYMKEKIEPLSFASGALISTMLKEMEHIFATRFERGNKKRAINHLRVGKVSKAHNVSTLRSGLWLGLALPAVAGGCYLSFQEKTRGSLLSWNILLFIYSTLLIPVLLALLVGINIFTWTRYRINYVFILKLNPRSRLDYREYFEARKLPSFLFCTLAYAFCFSLAEIGPPTLWPLVWLVLTAVVILNPIRSFMWGHARWWTIKKIAKLGASGIWTVQFTDLWLGDQACSLAYSLSNLYFVGCFYTHTFVDSPNTTMNALRSSLNASSPINVTTSPQAGSSVFDSPFRTLLTSAYEPGAQEAWSTCGAGQNWQRYWLLAMLPFLARFLQSLRRYWDSKLPSQLINAGKYGMGMIQYFLYYYWRHQVSPRTGESYVLFCFASTVNSIYGCAWDVLVDWSMCKPYARYPLLRPELLYKSQVPLYYLAMLTNLCIRFDWVVYVFFHKGNYELWAFIIAMMEMLRRVQWNFYRLESKHLSNVDLYRVMREPSLPYSFDMHSEEVEGELRLRKRVVRLS